MSASVLIKQVFHVFKKLYVAALVAGNGNTLCIFFYSTFNNFCYAAVMTQVNDFSTFTLQYSPHDVDCCIMTIEQRSGCYNSNFMCGYV